jgi:hypothetical protein
MNYGRIVEDSFKFAWRYKSLWVFGLLAGSSGGNFNLQFGQDDLNAMGGMGETGMMPNEFFQEFWHLILPFLAALIIIGLLFFILHLICSPALVDAINKIARGGSYHFADSYSRGIDFFLRKLGLTLIFIAAVLGAILLGILPIVALHLFGILLMIPIVAAGIFFAITLYNLAERALVVRDTSIGNAIDEAYILMKQNFSKCLIMALIFIGLSIGIGIVLLMVAAMFFFPINVLVHSVSESKIVIFVLALILGLPVSLVVGGFIGTFFHSLYTLFYFGLVDPHSPYAKPSYPQQAAPTPQ